MAPHSLYQMWPWQGTLTQVLQHGNSPWSQSLKPCDQSFCHGSFVLTGLHVNIPWFQCSRKVFCRSSDKYVWWFWLDHQTFWKKKNQTFHFKYLWKVFQMIRQSVWWFWTNHQTFCGINGQCLMGRWLFVDTADLYATVPISRECRMTKFTSNRFSLSKYSMILFESCLLSCTTVFVLVTFPTDMNCWSSSLISTHTGFNWSQVTLPSSKLSHPFMDVWQVMLHHKPVSIHK